jgi:2-polyprenyl-3-methyl-5-hydroxy-6-metoxy-1,4-benzoquinol methylase
VSEAAWEQSFVYGGNVNEDVLRGLGTISGRLLDVGCGEGSWAPLLRQAGASELVALDPSPGAIARAAELYDTAVIGTIEGTELASLGGTPFDAIVVADVLEHLVDPWAALRTLRAWAAPGAQLAVSVPNLRFYRLLGNLLFRGEFEYERYGVRWFTRRSLGRMLGAAGWEPQRWISTQSAKGLLLAKLSDALANDFLRQQLVVVARAR